MEPSKYQVKIYDVYDNTNDNIVVQACPGSGKTTTLLQLLKRTPKWKKTIFLAFNKSIQQELESRVPEGVKTSTIHSLGLGIFRGNMACSIKISEYKTFVLAKKSLPYLNMFEEKKRNSYLGIISQLYDLFRLNVLSRVEELEIVALEYGVDFTENHIKDMAVVIESIDRYNKSFSSHKEFLVDFTDMLYLPVQMVAADKFPRYDVVMVDEVQDLNKLQKKLIDRIRKPNGRFVAVGDKNQAIYAFIGANREVFEQFEKAPRTQVLPLSVSYRCAKKVVSAANEIFPGVEPFEANEEGVVRKGHIGEVEEGDFVICRNNLPLVLAYFDIAKEGKRVSILGRDLQQGLSHILSTVRSYPSFEEAVEFLCQDKERSIREKFPSIKNPKNHSSYRTLLEKVGIIRYLVNSCGSDMDLVENTIGNMFSDTVKGGVLLMTGHKSKGLESNRVFFLFPELIPSPFAETGLEKYQERCLGYVIVTRAKRELVMVPMSPVDQFRIKELGGVIKL